MSKGFVVLSQDGCSWCVKAKALLMEKGYAFNEINLSEVPVEDKKKFMEQFVPIERTVPKVYYDGVLIGGYSDLEDFFDNPISSIFLNYAAPSPIYAQRLSPTAIFPTRGTPESIGMDLYADLGVGESIILPPNETRLIKIGWALQAPLNHYLRIAPRSGLALKGGVDTLGGVVDRDYRNVVGVILATHGYQNVTIKHGDRIAQVIAERASIVPILEVPALDSTARGLGGFGSTGA